MPTHEIPRSNSLKKASKRLWITLSQHPFLPRFLSLFLISATIVSTIAFALFHHDHQLKHKVQVTGLHTTIDGAARDFETAFQSTVADLRFLAATANVRRFFDNGDRQQASLTQELINFSRLKGVYDQIRLIDSRGMEALRINHNNGNPQVIAQDKLQNKRNRYYFVKTFRQEKNQIYISPLDLNMEQGRVETPYKPVIRFGVPIFNVDGEKRGVLIINYLAADLLKKFQQPAEEIGGSLNLLNQKGYWLSGGDKNENWAFMFADKRGLTFSNHYPGVWKAITTMPSGSYHGEEGDFYFTTIVPEHIKALQKSATFPSVLEEHQWKVVLHMPTTFLAFGFISPTQLGLYLLILAGIGVGAWFHAKSSNQEALHLTSLKHQREQLQQQLVAQNLDLQKSHGKLELLLASTGDGLYGIDVEYRCTFINQAALDLLGFTNKEDVLGRNLNKLIHSNPLAGFSNNTMHSQLRKVFRGKSIHLDDRKLWRSDGHSFSAEVRAHPIEDDDGIIGAVVTFNDISERKQDQERLRTLSQAVEQSPVSVVMTDPEGNIEYVNSNFEKLTGYSAKEVLGKNPNILQSGQTSEKTYREMWQAISNGKPWQGELLNRRKNGEIFHDRAHIAPVMNEHGVIKHYLGVQEDITLQKQQEELILHQAHFDTLTDLPNRFLALDRLSQLLIEAERNRNSVAVMFIDLDDFKKINDTLGHEAGDKILVEAATRLRQTVRGGDTVARLGGDEFLVLLGDLSNPIDARPIAENLLARFRKPFRIDERDLVLTASIGIAVSPLDGESSSDLLRNADSAMYHAKERGRNAYSYFTETMNQEIERRLLVEEQMHGALDREEFYLHFQPQIDVNSSEISGAEALLRWNNPVLGEVTPDEFIPIAEQTGLIIPLGKFVLQEALSLGAWWQKTYDPGFTISVNLSPRQFRDTGLVTFIQYAIEESGVKQGSLELEITEGVLMSGHAYTDDVLAGICNLNICIAMDDFGTGYSSLSYLRRYPFHVLKIDRSFIADITRNNTDRELVQAAIAMGHGLGMCVVAEGVETEPQLNLLKQLNCDRAQGFFLGEAIAPKNLEEMLKHQSGENGNVFNWALYQKNKA